MKKLLRLLILPLAILVLTPWPVFSYQNELKELAAQMSASLAKSGRTTVAVVDFTDLQGNATELGRFLAEEMSVALVNQASSPTGQTSGLKVIDRTHLRAIIQEHKLGSSGLIDPQTARRLGEIAGVQALGTGTITPFGESVRLTVKVLDTSTAEMLGASTADIPKTRAIEELLVRNLSGAGQPAPPFSAPSITGGSAAPAGGTVVQAGDFLLAFKECRLRDDSVTCIGKVVNKAQKTKTFGLTTQTNMIDNTGKQSVQTPTFTVGAVEGGIFNAAKQELEPDVPVNFSIKSVGLDPAATSATVRIRYFDEEWKWVTLRDIHLTRNAPTGK